jgi:hypothetical protein
MRFAVAAAALLVAAAAPAGAREDLRLESRRTVDWGYGCGGHCAVRTEGRSTITLVVGGNDARVVDEGAQTMRESHEGGGVKQETRWSYRWRGRVKLGATELELDLVGGGQCARSEESSDDGATRKAKLSCPKPPRTLQLTCARKETDIDGAPRATWTCNSRGRSPGTDLPWVFGIDQPIDTVVRGEPQPETTYVLRAK